MFRRARLAFEYGMAVLPTVATSVGQCVGVLDEGRVGILVSPSTPNQLSEGLLSLLSSPERRSSLGEHFHYRVRDSYSPAVVIKQICRVYETVLASPMGSFRSALSAVQKCPPLQVAVQIPSWNSELGFTTLVRKPSWFTRAVI